MFKKTLLATAIVAGALAGLAPIAANAQYNAVVVREAPPPPVHEVMPGERPGFVWAPGHYEWRRGHYAWMRGHWMPERAGYAYREPRWTQRGNGEWVLIGGDWVRRDDRYAQGRRYDEERWERDHHRPRADRDRDGVPNRFDRAPNDPYRR